MNWLQQYIKHSLYLYCHRKLVRDQNIRNIIKIYICYTVESDLIFRRHQIRLDRGLGDNNRV